MTRHVYCAAEIAELKQTASSPAASMAVNAPGRPGSWRADGRDDHPRQRHLDLQRRRRAAARGLHRGPRRRKDHPRRAIEDLLEDLTLICEQLQAAHDAQATGTQSAAHGRTLRRIK